MIGISVTGDIVITQHDQLLCRLHDQLGWRATPMSHAEQQIVSNIKPGQHLPTARLAEKLLVKCEWIGLLIHSNDERQEPFGGTLVSWIAVRKLLS